MAYGIMRCEKRKMQACGGIHEENNRDATKRKEFCASDIDWEKTHDNIYFVKSDNFKADIEKELHEHGIDKWRKDAVAFIDGLYTASPEFFENKTGEEITDYFKDCLEYHRRTYGDHIINAVVHLDEATPHMHVVSVPIVEKEVEMDDELGIPKPMQKKYKLSAKELMGGLKDYYKRQDSFYEQVTKQYGLERGESRNPEQRKKHLSVLEYKEQQVGETLQRSHEALEQKQSEVEKLDKQIKGKEDRLTTLDGDIKAAKDLRKEKSNKGLFGRSKDEITIPYSEYRTLQKTAKAIEDVQRSERVLKYDRDDFEKEKANIQPRLEEVARVEKEASEKLSKAQKYLDEQESYIYGTAERIAQDKFDEFIQEHYYGSDSIYANMCEYLRERYSDADKIINGFGKWQQEQERELLDAWDNDWDRE